MKNILKYIIMLMFTFIGTACEGECGYTIKENMLIVTVEELHSDSLSIYTLRFENTVPTGWGKPTTDIRLISNSNAFKVSDKIKFVKVEK